MYCKYNDCGWCHHPDRDMGIGTNACSGMEFCELEEFNAYDHIDQDEVEEIDFNE